MTLPMASRPPFRFPFMKTAATNRSIRRLSPRGRAQQVRALAAAGAAVLLLPLPAVLGQQPPPRPAEVVDDNPTPAPVPRAQVVPEQPATPPKAEVIPDEENPAPSPGEGEKPTTPKTSPKPASPKTSPDDELFAYCEMLFAKSDFSLALRQYGEYQRLFPSGKHKEEARFKIAEVYYFQKNYDVAAMELDNFIRDFPSSKNRARALYHTGESHYSIGTRATTMMEDRAIRLSTAEAAYRAVLQTTKTGPYAAYAAFRLGCFAYNAAAQDSSKYAQAIRHFGVAAAQAPKERPEIRFASLFFKGQSAKFSGSNKEAAAAFEEVVKTPENNIYYEKAMRFLAEMDVEAGRKGAALDKFVILAKEAKLPDNRADAMVNAGMLLSDSGKVDDAMDYYEQALKVPGATISQSRARGELIFASYRLKDWQKAVDLWRGMSADLNQMDDGRRAQLLLVVASCYSALNQQVRAVEVYNILEAGLPNSPEALEGGYKRLVCMLKLNDPRVTDEAKNYIEHWRELQADSAFLDKAWIVRAVYYYNRGVWQPAAESYAKVRENKLEPERLANYYYQRGFAESSQGLPEAVSTLNTFISKYPDDERMPSALLQRGIAEWKAEDLPSALKDFETVRDKYPKSDSAESASYHAAKIKGRKEDYPGMVADFQKLLKTFPETKVAAEANYWIGFGYFTVQKYAECLEPLRKARIMDSKAHYADATFLLISALAQLQEIDPLMVEVDGYLKGTQEKKIDPTILSWLGMTVFRDRHDYAAAARYLSQVVNRDTPSATHADLWRALGESYLESRNPELALLPLENFLASGAPPMELARGHLLKARSYYALNRLEEATKSAEAGLSIDKETLVSAQLRLVLGDVAMASKRYTEAASSYGLVMGYWEDPTVTPLAMEKYISACEASGDAANRAKAQSTRGELKKRFPRYQQTVTTTASRNSP